MRGKVPPRTGLVTEAIHQVVGGGLHGLIHLLPAGFGAQAVEAEAVELVGVGEGGVVEDGVLDVGADVRARREEGAVRESQVLQYLAESANYTVDEVGSIHEKAFAIRVGERAGMGQGQGCDWSEGKLTEHELAPPLRLADERIELGQFVDVGAIEGDAAKFHELLPKRLNIFRISG